MLEYYVEVNIHIRVYQNNSILDGSTYEKTENYNSDSGVTKSDKRNTKKRSEFVPLQMIVSRNGKKNRDFLKVCLNQRFVAYFDLYF